MRLLSAPILALVMASSIAVQARGQANANAIAGAEDAFGYRKGDESVGIYDETSVRGFDLAVAGNYRINGSYFVKNSGVSSFFLESTAVRIGYNTLNVVLPGPLGVVHYRLRDPARGEASLFSLERDASGGLHMDAHYKHRTADDEASYSLGLGLVANLSNEQGGDGGRGVLLAGVTRQTLGAVTARLFGGEYQYRRPSLFRVVPSEQSTPPQIGRGRYLGQRWSMEKGQRRIAGALVDVGDSAAFGAGATLVFSQEDPTLGFRQFLDDLRADGTARQRMNAAPQQRTTSWSGELRAHREWSGRSIRHRVDLMLRGRRSRARVGGAVTIDLGRAPFGEPAAPVAKPDLSEAVARVRDGVDQWGLGLAYRAFIGALSVNAGVLRSDYSKRVRTADRTNRTSTKPLLYNLGIALRAARGLDLYATYSRGLEEAGVAPANAANRDAVLEAIPATQREVGIQYRISDALILVLGAFDTRKPYIGLDAQTGIYGPLGQVRHRGVELSVAGKPRAGLSVVLGGVILDPRITGQLVTAGQIGRRPVAVPRVRAIANIDYGVPRMNGLSVDAGLTYLAARPARSRLDESGQQLFVSSKFRLDAGLRYRFAIDRRPLTMRAQLLNVTDRFAWDVDSSETLAYMAGRQARLALTAEF